MSYRKLSGKQSLLRIFIGEFDKYQHQSLYEVILNMARKSGLAGCTVLRGISGFGRGKRIHSDTTVESADDHPILIELVDQAEQISKFLNQIKPLLTGALVTEEDVSVHHYRHSSEAQPNMTHGKNETKEPTQTRTLQGDHTLLRIYLGESDKCGHTSLHLTILKKARELGLAGCTTLRGIAGFGASSVVHTDRLLRLSSDLPVIMEIVDTEDRVNLLLEQVSPMLSGTLVTEEKIKVRHYESRVQ